MHRALGGQVARCSESVHAVDQTVDNVVIIDRGRLVANARLDELTAAGDSLEDRYLALTAGMAS
jgi:ABC-2 type transport system ATP-binding protein